MEHTFHTRHDFTPELGWAAFQLLAELGSEGTTAEAMEEVANKLASPLARRSDLGKLMLSLQELGLVRQERGRLALSRAGRDLAATAGRYETGFHAGVHALYFWRWLWSGRLDHATPSWSYHQVCEEIRRAGPLGIEPDTIVLKVAAAGRNFGAERVSFSRSSVNGVTNWLKAQVPALIAQAGTRICPVAKPKPGLTLVRYQLAGLCRLHGGEVCVETEVGEHLANALLVAPQELRWVLREFVDSTEEFVTIGGGKRIVYRQSSDPFLEWMVHGRQDEN